MQHRAVGSGDVFALDEDDGTVKPVESDGFVTLGVDTYLFPLSVPEANLYSVHIQTDGTIAGTFTIETCNFPKCHDEMGQTSDVTDWDTATSGLWIKEDPTGAYVASVGTGWAWTLLTGVKTAGAGGAMIHLGNLGSKRLRLKAVITTGGKIRVNRHAKS